MEYLSDLDTMLREFGARCLDVGDDEKKDSLFAEMYR